MPAQNTADPNNAPASHPKIAMGKIGVLLVNLGTPQGTDYWSIRRYLSEFLSDRRVIELSPLLWQPLLQGIILTLRPGKTGRAYAKIWDRARNESPLRGITRAQAQGIQARLGALHQERVVVGWAMRYGTPSIAQELQALKEQGCDRILVAPLYPQYSAATTASVLDCVYDTLKKWRWQPALRTLPPYYQADAYIDALVHTVRQSLKELAWVPDKILVSFHGMPRETLDKGDPYHCQCQKTARLLQERLALPKEQIAIVFQSRFGPKEWLKPYASTMIAALPSQGVKRLAILSPGFAADCLETLEEINIGLKEVFIEQGGEDFHYIACLNDSALGLEMLASLLNQELLGWL
jgi:protoporphyrin/coproporphyrin ferrochelatase